MQNNTDNINNVIKAIFFDIDGTLFSHKLNDVPASTRYALARLRSRGVKTVVATGRHMLDFRQLPVKDISFDAYIMLNGQLIFDEDKKIYASTPIKHEEMEILSRIFEAKQIPVAFVGKNREYINYVNDTVIRTQAATKGTVPQLGNYSGEDIYQAMAFVPEHQKELLNGILDECSITSWNDTGIDIIPKGGGKVTGIKEYLEGNNLDRSEIMAFGDGENDMEMLHFAGIGVAMGNAGAPVKAIADYVTDTVEHNGIEKALKHFGLI